MIFNKNWKKSLYKWGFLQYSHWFSVNPFKVELVHFKNTRVRLLLVDSIYILYYYSKCKNFESFILWLIKILISDHLKLPSHEFDLGDRLEISRCMLFIIMGLYNSKSIIKLNKSLIIQNPNYTLRNLLIW